MGHRRIHKRHVALIAQHRIGFREHRHTLRRRHALTRQRRLVDLQRRRRDDAPVRAHVVTGIEHHHITDHDLVGVDGDLGAIATHAGGGLQHRLQRVHRALRLALLAHTAQGVECGDRQHRDPRAHLTDEQRGDRRSHQDDLHVGLVLPEEQLPARGLGFGRQGILTIGSKSAGRLGGAEPGGNFDPNRSGGFLRTFGVPGCGVGVRGRRFRNTH